MQVFNYKKVDLSNLTLSKPEKTNDEKIKYISNLTFDKKDDIYIQTPVLTYNSEDKTLLFDLHKDADFFSFVEKLKDRIVEILYNNSEKFFKGKKFSYNWIYKAVSTLNDINTDGQSIIQNIKLSENVKIYDHFKERVYDIKDKKYRGMFILNIKNIEFSGKNIKINIFIDSIKLEFKREPIKEVCLVESDEESEKLDSFSESSAESLISDQDFFT